MGARFFLGVGAQKSGTSWLHGYLARHPDFDFGPLKEYHVWDALTVDACRGFLVRPDQLCAVGADGAAVPSRTAFLRFQLQHRQGAYEQFFRNMITGGVTATGDFSPSYAGLSAATLEQIRTRLERVGFEVRPIFLMRDPFERCWSAARMYKAKGWATGTDEEVLRALYASRQFALRTDYRATVQQLERVFAPSDIHFGIYEELLSPRGLAAISRFCGVAPDASFTGIQLNATPKSETISAGLSAEVLARYAEVYEFCHERFPQTSQLWHAPA